MENQSSNSILMVRPANFGYNKETEDSNPFQKPLSLSDQEIQSAALLEFDEFTNIQKKNGIDVVIVKDSASPVKTDALFPNNWISSHPDNRVAIYPMFSVSRRAERKNGVVDLLKKRFSVDKEDDFTSAEADNRFMEGTGSMVLDRVHKQAFGCLSNRTNENLFREICTHLGYEPVAFHATDLKGLAIYHTNVMMCIGSSFAVICAESIKSKKEQREVLHKLRATGHEIVEISQHQMSCFAGNMLEVRDKAGNKLIVMSRSAYNSLSLSQQETLQKHGKLLPIPIPTIETIGGGSVRCMMAEIFLTPLK